MNILFITSDFYPNSTGFANASINLINAIIKYSSGKYIIHVFTEQQLKGKEELPEIYVIRYKYNGKKNKLNRLYRERKKYLFIKDYVKNNNIDIIFFETNTFPFVQNWIVKEFPYKVFVRIHSTADTEVPIYGEHPTFGSKISLKKMKEFMKYAPNIVSTSNYYLDFIKKEYFESNVYTIWNNKSYGLLYNTSVDGIKKAKPSCSNTFMTMGKMSHNGVIQKGIKDLLNAVFYLKIDGYLDDTFKLIIVGDGEKYYSIQSMVNRLNLEKYVLLIKSASHDEVFELISQSKAIILLSRYEGQSMFITETLSLGKPVILSDNNGMEDMIVPGKNGLLTRTGDARMAADSIRKIMSLTLDEVEEMGNCSRQLYQTKFSPRAVYDQFDRLMTLREEGQ